MMSFDRNILYLSAFGELVNNAVSGGAVKGILQEIAESDNPMVAPWTSATPLSGELLQASLNALLQNDMNLLSAYPDAYLKPTYNSTSYTNIQQFSYGPAGAGQTLVSDNDGWTNSVMVSSYVGTVGGETSAVMLGSLVPSYPFQQGKVWNYGVFGVEDGVPKWFNIKPSNVTMPDYYLDCKSYQPMVNDVFTNANILTGKFKSGDLIDIYVDGDGYVFSKNAGNNTWNKSEFGSNGGLGLSIGEKDSTNNIIKIYSVSNERDIMEHNIGTIHNKYFVTKDCEVSSVYVNYTSNGANTGGASIKWVTSSGTAYQNGYIKTTVIRQNIMDNIVTSGQTGTISI